MVTRIAACWRKDEHYVLRDLNANPITDAEGRALCAVMKPPAPLKPVAGTGRRSKESHSAPSTGPSTTQATNRRKSA